MRGFLKIDQTKNAEVIVKLNSYELFKKSYVLRSEISHREHLTFLLQISHLSHCRSLLPRFPQPQGFDILIVFLFICR